MSALAIPEAGTLPALVRAAADKIAKAETAAEILEARELAGVAYDTAKRAARLAKAKSAHDELISVAYRAQADALEIESMAKRRLADEYDAAQERGEVRTRSDNQYASSRSEEAVSAADIGLTHKEIHDARQIRDAERANPGVIRRTLDTMLGEGREPTKAAVRREIIAKPQPQVSDGALWLWGRLMDFERRGLLGSDPHPILMGMTPQMQADVARLAPLVRELMEELETCFEPA
jgi:hypothetical protein